jgi:hypothetical protein
MQNLKTNVLTALQTATALSALTGFYFQYPSNFTNLPCLSYFEVTNIGNLFADDQEIGSEIIFQVDLWGKASLSTYADAVGTAMSSIDFSRIYCTDLYDNDSKIYHKAMRFRRDYSDPTF